MEVPAHPPTHPKVHSLTHEKPNRTLKSSLLHQLGHLAASRSLCSLSERYQRDVFTLAVIVVPTDTQAHTVRTKCDKGNTANRVRFLLLLDISQLMLNIQEMASKTTRLIPVWYVCVCFKSTWANQAVTARPVFVLSLNRARHVQSVSLRGAWLPDSYFRGS